MRWDPEQYGHYAGERARPYFDLLTRVRPPAEPRHVVDLGCGPGELTLTLAQRWPNAVVEGIDSSPEMIQKAQLLSSSVTFRLGDIAAWTPDDDVDVVVTNAALQWVPDHSDVIKRWLPAMSAGGVIAWQVPGNFESPSHQLMREVGDRPRWREFDLDRVLGFHDTMPTPVDYARLLLDAGWTADVWETTYLHVLPGVDPVLEWVRGTGLRPALAALGEHAAEYEQEYAAELRRAYPAGAGGTVFPFRRIFAVGHKP
ncbi:MAG: trans-aconitate 2-methyltransferase [Actinobacteria bacterium]|nr:trans-aconitate 2-methyltransferase [Actinomycetota bacterium]